jgi:hypothetical protein
MGSAIMVDHEALIETLSRSASPVERPLSTAVRAAGWMMLALPAGLLATGLVPKAGIDWSDAGAIWAGLAIGLSFLLGMSAIMAAFAISIAGRAVRLGIWFAIGIALWLIANLAGIAMSPHPLGRMGSGGYCFQFMVLASAPMIGLAIIWLRRTRAIHPDQTLTMAGVGIAFTSLTLLGFCHPAAGHLFDFTGHVAAAVSIVGLTVLCGRRWIAI